MCEDSVNFAKVVSSVVHVNLCLFTCPKKARASEDYLLYTNVNKSSRSLLSYGL